MHTIHIITVIYYNYYCRYIDIVFVQRTRARVLMGNRLPGRWRARTEATLTHAHARREDCRGEPRSHTRAASTRTHARNIPTHTHTDTSN